MNEVRSGENDAGISSRDPPPGCFWVLALTKTLMQLELSRSTNTQSMSVVHTLLRAVDKNAHRIMQRMLW